MEPNAASMNQTVYLESLHGLNPSPRRLERQRYAIESKMFMMGHGIGLYLGLNEIGSPSSIIIFIIISYLFNRNF